MPPLQTTFGATIPTGYPGMVANAELQNRITRTIEDAGGIAFGAAAFRGSAAHLCTATPSAEFLGVVIVDHGQIRRAASAGADQYDENDNVPIMERGTICVNASVAVGDGDPVYITPAGAFTNVNGGGANFRAGNFFYDTDLAAAGIARISNNRGA